MPKISYVFHYALSLIALGLVFSCSTDFDATTDPVESAIMYSLVSTIDTTHYVRLEKMFLVQNNAQQAATNPKNIYFDEGEVKVEVFKENEFLTTARYVIGDDEGFPKEDGLFATDPHVLYRFDSEITAATEYTVKATNQITGKIYNATFTTPDTLLFIRPFQSVETELEITNNRFEIGHQLDEFASIYNVKLRFHYREFFIDNPSEIKDTFARFFEYDVVSGFVPLKNQREGGVTEIIHIYDMNRLLNQMASAIPTPSSSNIGRRFDDDKVVGKGIQLILTGVGDEFLQLEQSLRAQSGLVSNEAVLPFSNVEGGLGIVSGISTTISVPIFINNPSLDEIACNPLTKDLKFVNSQGVICR